MMQKSHSIYIAILAVLLAMFAPSETQAQLGPKNLVSFDDRFFHFGFLLGGNSSSFYIDKKPVNLQDSAIGITNIPTAGFDLHLLASLDLSKNIRLRFFPGLSFQDRGLTYTWRNQDGTFRTTEQRTESVFLDFPLMLKLRTNRYNNFAAYGLIGGRYSIDMQSQEKVNNQAASNQIIKIEPRDYAIEAGGGFDFFLPYFKFGLEAKVGIGLPNMLIDDGTAFTEPLQSLRTRTFVFTITIEG